MDIGDNQIKDWSARLAELEDQTEAVNEAKKELYASIRDEHGRYIVASLKLAMRWSRMDAEKRQDHETMQNSS